MSSLGQKDHMEADKCDEEGNSSPELGPRCHHKERPLNGGHYIDGGNVAIDIEQEQEKKRNTERIATSDLTKIWEWNATVPECIDECVHDLLVAVSRRQPDSTAIKAWDGELAYSQLDDLSSQLARHLIMLGVGPEVVVPLCFEKSVWTPVAMLAVMRAGGACLTLDLSLPEERLRSIVSQVRPKVFLSSLDGRLVALNLAQDGEGHGNAVVMTVSEGDIGRLTTSPTNPSTISTSVTPLNALYLVFTSGSTGIPKGVVITHSNFASALHHQKSSINLNVSSRVLDFASYSFDMSWYNILHTLYAGACLIIPNESERKSGLSSVIRNMRPDFANLTPTVASTLDDEALKILTAMEVAGEPCNDQLLERQQRLKPGQQFRNVYGPSECTAVATVSANVQHTTHIGTGVGSRTWVVRADDPSQLVPIGSVGELWIEGPLVGRGYWNNEEQTAGAFVQDPPWLLSGAPGFRGRKGRLYRTGDLVRYEQDGTLTYQGRKDEQVKIRGQRLELGDVEHHVQKLLGQSHQGKVLHVVAAVIIPKNHRAPLLVAFIGQSGARTMDKDQLRTEVKRVTSNADEMLAEVMPSYMVPTAYIPLSSLPLTVSGKTDRRRIAELGSSLTIHDIVDSGISSDNRRMPLTASEKRLQKLWSTVLGVDETRISADDSFLRLGGDSISAMKLVTCARQQGVLIAVAHVLKHPRLSDMASVLADSPEGINHHIPSPFSMIRSPETTRREAASRCGVRIESIRDIFPCTPLQEGLMAMTSRREGQYVAKLVFSLASRVDVPRFQNAWDEMVAETQILQTRIVDVPEDGLLQVVVDTPQAWGYGTDLDSYLKGEDKHPMGLGLALNKPGLVSDSKRNELWFVLTIHHSLYDGMSLPLLLQSVQQRYEGCEDHKLMPLQSFVKHLRSQDRPSLDEFWRSQLTDSRAVPFPELPSPGYVPQAKAMVEKQVTDLPWPKDDYTPSTLLKAAWALLQARYTDTPEAVFGTVSTGRQAAMVGVDRVAGPTIATVPLRIVCAGDKSVKQLLQEIQAQAVDMIAYEQAGLHLIRRLSEDAERGCRFQSLLVVQPEEQGLVANSKEGLWAADTNRRARTGTTEYASFNTYAIMILCNLSKANVQVEMSYDASVVHPAQAERILDQFEHILRQMANPTRADYLLREINAMNQSDLNKIWTWNHQTPASVDSCLHEMVMYSIERFPDSVAVCAWDGEFTYAQIDRLSSNLAHQLTERGVEAEVIVPICMEKSKWTVVAILGVLRAGVAFTLMTPTMPKGRRESVLELTDPRFVLGTTKTSGLFPAHEMIHVDDSLWNDTETNVPASKNHKAFAMATPSSTAAVYFTSGSTGVPKGISLSHRAVVTSVHAAATRVEAGPSTRLFQFGSYLFDHSLWDHFMALNYGGCLCIPSEYERDNETSQAIVRFRANMVHLTPSVANMISVETVIATLETLIFSGEALRETDVLRWKNRKVKLWNWYGPTECPAGTLIEVVPGKWKNGMIGRGMASTPWIVEIESPDKLAPVGAVGELVLEGPAVAKGYLKNPQGTQASFIQDPPWLLRGDSGSGRRERLYKTGDLVRYNPDGIVIYLGRKDAQVKIRGQRVELPEIEHHLRQVLPDGHGTEVVAETIVPRGGNTLTLVAYICTAEGKEQSEKTAVRLYDEGPDKLANILPSYMIPSLYIPVDKIPMSASGKTDRRRLREIGSALSLEDLASLLPQRDQKSRTPETVWERRVQMLWSSILRIPTESISAEDSFLSIGGDSIAAMRVVGAARDQGLSISVTDLFRHPKLSDLAEYLHGAADTAAALDDTGTVVPFSLLRKKSKKDARSEASKLCQIEVSQVQDVFACTPLQAGLLALTAQREKAYVARYVLQLRSSIELDRFQAAWERVVAVAPILRTRIVDMAIEGLVQVVVDEKISWKAATDVENYLTADASKAMGLGSPLVRFAIVRREQVYTFVLTLHHATFDGWSLSLLFSMVEQAYRALQPLQLPPSFQAFVSYVLKNDRSHAELLWKEQLDGIEAQPFPALPTSTYRPNAQCEVTHRFTGVQWPTRRNLTMSTVVRAALALLIATYTDSPDVLFGATVTGRQAPVPGVERMTGPTLTTVPIRVVMDLGAQNVDQFLLQVQQQAVNLVAIEHVGLQAIRQVSSSADRACHFQTLLMVQPMVGDGSKETTETLFDDLYEDTGALSAFNSYAMLLYCDLEREGLTLKLSFDDAVVSKPEVERIAEQLEHLVRQLCSPVNASKKLTAIDTTSHKNLEDIWAWNTPIPASSTTANSVHELISHVARQQPNRPALSGWDGELTYGELEILSSNLAHQLVGTYNVGPEVVVPVCFEKSIWTAVAVLGVMKAGGASVTLDVGQPEERLRTIVTQVSPPVIIASSDAMGLAVRLSGHRDQVVLADGANLAEMKQNQSSALPQGPSSSALYVVFTSGSTGAPKGVIITHANFLNAIEFQRPWLGITSISRVLDFTSYAFDVFWQNILMALTAGACFCTPSSTQRMDELSDFIIRHEVNHAAVTPSIARAIDFSSVGVLNTTGEKLTRSDIQSLKGKPVKLLNTYGPAECTVTATGAKISASGSGQPSIGRGLGVVPWIVSTNWPDRLAPIGAIGELYLEGPLVARGYLNDAAKTAAAFLDDPLWLVSGPSGRRGRVYKTGDLVRYASDGSLTFIGRNDGQIKIRGQRVELSEIEHHVQSVLSEEGAHNAKVITDILIPAGSNRQILMAFIMLAGLFSAEQDREDEIKRLSSDLNERLADRIPSYMIPTKYVPLESIPMTATGKTDRRRLRELVSSIDLGDVFTDQQKHENVNPSNNVERELREIWAEVLNIPPESLSTDVAFTQLGGDSISAMQVVSRSRARKILVTVADVLRAQTIQRVAGRVRVGECLPTAQMETEEEARAADERGWPLSPIQRIYLDAHPHGPYQFNQSFVFKLQRLVSTHALREATKAVVERHSMLRACFRRAGDGTWVQFVPQSTVPDSIFVEHQVSEMGAALLLMQNRQRSLDIETGPLFAVDVFAIEGGDRQQVILLSASHLVIDLVSWRVIWHDLQQALSNEPLMVPPIPFRIWCHDQRRTGKALRPSQVLPFTPERPRFEYWGIETGANQFRRYDIFKQYLTAETTSVLLGKANDSLGSSPLDILVATLIRSFTATFRDRKPPPVFLEGHGREAPEGWKYDISETVGWFTTIHPLQICVKRAQSLYNTIREVKDLRKLLPDLGRSYLASQYYGDVTAGESSSPGGEMELTFDYQGQFQQLESKDSLFLALDEIQVQLEEIAPDHQMMSLIDVRTVVVRGQMEVLFCVNQSLRQQDKIREWAHLYINQIEEAIRTLVTAPQKFSRADFPLLRQMSYEGLDHLLEQQLPEIGILPAQVQDAYPCTPLQEGILLSRKTGAATYANHWIWLCEGPRAISSERLINAWQATFMRHSVFSTIFVDHPETGGFIQIVRRDAKHAIGQLDSGSTSPAHALRSFNCPPFGAGQPEVRVTVAQANHGGELACRLDISHALTDAASLNAIIECVKRAYRGLELAAAPQLRDAIEYLNRTPHSERLAYWSQVLKGLRTCRFPTEEDLCANEGPGYQTLPVHVAGNSRIYDFCREYRITRATFLQVVWALVLSRFVNVDVDEKRSEKEKCGDVCFGFLASGRDMPIDGIDRLIGPTINMLVSRVSLGTASSHDLRTVLKATGEQTIEHLAHQHVSLAEVQRAVGSGPLFNSAITVREADTHYDDVEDHQGENHLRMTDFYVEDAQEFDIGLGAGLDGAETSLMVGWRADQISSSTGKAVVETVQSAIEYLLNYTGNPVSVGAEKEAESLQACFFRHLVGADEEAVNTFWRTQFAGLEATPFPVLPSATYRPRREATADIIITSQQGSDVNLTTEPAIRAAWAFLQARHTATDDVIFGLALGGGALETDTALVVPARFVMDGEMTIASLESRDQEQMEALGRYKRTGLLHIRRTSEEARRACQFQAVLVVQRATATTANTANRAEEMPNFPLSAENNGLEHSSKESLADYALVIGVESTAKSVRVTADYDSSILRTERVQRMLEQYENILRQIVAPGRSHIALERIEAASKSDLADIWRWNRDLPLPSQTTVHEMFSKVAQQKPSAQAVCAWNGNLTFQQLDELSTRLAHQLVRLWVDGGNNGKGLSHHVGLCFEKSLWMPVALLGVMKAGLTAVPMDVSQPEERLRAVVRQVDAQVIICSTKNSELSTRLRHKKHTAIVAIDEASISSIPAKSVDARLPSVDPATAVVIVFTSGSTGEPKGITISHSNLATALDLHRQHIGFTPSSRALDFASYAFDVSWYVAFGAMCAGGCVCVPSDYERKNDLAGAILRMRVTYAALTPTVVKTLDHSVVKTLEILLLGGEAVSEAQAEELSALTNVIIAYGPAECTVGVAFAWRKRGGRKDQGIGYGVGACLWVVDATSFNRLVGVGCVGELLIEGPLVGDYLNDPVKSASAFIEDPHWLIRGGRRGRLYKSGDLVRLNTDGTLTFVGRKDGQVKIRGQRVELGEVEQQILSQMHGDNAVESGDKEGVHVVADLITPHEINRTILVAFVTPKGAEMMSSAKLVEIVTLLVNDVHPRVVSAAPVYMVPQGYIPLARLPTVTSGKVDRRRLREIGRGLPLAQLIDPATLTSAPRQQPPSTLAERQLQQLWASTLGINSEEIYTDSSFLRLGGDSVLAMRLVAAARKRGVTLTVADIFTHPTLFDLAQLAKAGESMNEDTIEPFSLLRLSEEGVKPQQRAALLCDVDVAAIQDAYPCTPLQEGLLALTAQKGGDYVAKNKIQLQHGVDIERFKLAWEAVTAATPVLRTRIVDIPEQGLVQVIVNETVKWRAADSFSETMGLGTPLSHVGVTSENGERYFSWSVHHALYDGFSISLVLQAVRQAYDGAQPRLSPLQPFIQYTMAAQNDEAQNFWKNQFTDLAAPRFPLLPSARYRPRAQALITHTISGLGRSPSGFTMSTAIRAAWAILISRYTGSPDAVFGAIVNGRQAAVPGIERIPGPTLATVPVRITIDYSQPLQQLLRQVQRQTIEMGPFEQTGLQNIQKLSAETEEACHFQSLLVVQSAHSEATAVDTIFARPSNMDDLGADIFDAFATYALTLACEFQDQDLHLILSIDPNVVEASQASRMAEQLEHILRQICVPTHQNVNISQVNLLSPTDSRDIAHWNAGVPPTTQRCVHEMFGDIVQTRPRMQAVDAHDGQLTFSELDRLATRLANQLIDLGVKPETIVPLLFEKSKWMPVATLGVMKAGGVSVGLDVNQPEDRLRSIISQVNPSVVLLSRQNADFTVSLDPQIVNVVVDADHLQELTDDRHRKSTVQPHNSLYVVFTSGSTGNPKGVVITHSNFASLCELESSRLSFESTTRALDFASYAFDTFWALNWAIMCVGGCVCVPSESQRRNLDELSQFIREKRVTYLACTPTMAKTLDSSLLQSLEYVNLGGEAVTEGLVKRILTLTRVVVAYGPSECTIGVLYAQKYLGEKGLGFSASANTWVVDVLSDQLAGVGCLGELWIEGPLVGQGYLNNKEKTASFFVEDPDWSRRDKCELQRATNGPQGTRRIYKTGDLVRYNEDGSLMFVGRKDTQVKIRGQRVELGEVEHHVLQQLAHDEVQGEELETDAIHVVAELVRPQGAKSTTLVCFVAQKAATKTADAEDVLHSKFQSLTRRAHGRLLTIVPSYMVPSAYVPLASIPITTTGKADRRRLRQMAEKLSMDQLIDPSRTSTGPRRMPSTWKEKQLSRLWSSTLDIDPCTISPEDSFFGLGGDSIQAMRLVAAMQRCGLLLSVMNIFQNPTLEAMANVLKVEEGNSVTIEPFSLLEGPCDVNLIRHQAATLCDVQESAVEDIYPCTPIQEGLLAISARKSGDYCAHHVLPLEPNVDPDRFQRAWEMVVAATPILKTRVVDLPNRGLVQVVVQDETPWLSPEVVGRSIASILGNRLSEVGLQNSEGTTTFVWSIHHALYDAWTLDLVLNSVRQAYWNNSPSKLVPFAPFIQHTLALPTEVAQDYWRKQFADLNAPQFPVLPSVEHQPRAGQVLELTIRGFGRGHLGGFTTSSALRAAWGLLLMELTNASEAVFGVVVSGRQAEVRTLDQLAGPTIATVPIRIKVDKKQEFSVERLLEQVQSQGLEMAQYEQTGLQNIQRVSPEAGEACRFQSLLVVQPPARKAGSDTEPDDRNIFSPHPTSEKRENDKSDALGAFSNYALTVVCEQHTDDLRLMLGIDSKVVSIEQAKRMITQLEHYVRQLCDSKNLQTNLHQIDWISSSDLKDIWGWNAHCPDPVDRCVHDLLADTIGRQPNAPALQTRDETLTYHELDDLSTRLAHNLIGQGVGPEVIVPLCFEKSICMPIAMLAVMKAGGTVTGLDVTQPEERLRTILDRVAPVVVLSSRNSHELAHRIRPTTIAERRSIQVISIDTEFVRAMPATDRETLPQVPPSTPLYLVFTSGTTGEPKGVIVSHSNFASELEWQTRILEFTSTSRVVDFASYAFDVCWATSFMTLYGGGCVCIPSEHERKNNLSNFIREMQATSIPLTPTVLETIDKDVIRTLQSIELGGEAVSDGLIQRMLELTKVRIVYGPSECTIGVTVARKELGDLGLGYGAGACLWVVDPASSDRLVGVGGIGELFIEGPLVGPGYFQDEVKTRAAFIQDPVWLLKGSPGSPGRSGRVYQTGDLVRYNEDGSLTFMGRKDAQVKIRGQRVELEAVEHLIITSMRTEDESEKGQIQVVAELVSPSHVSQPMLVAFILPQGAEGMSQDALVKNVSHLMSGVYERMESSVPAYMIPAVYVPLSTLPMTATGKADRRRLRELAKGLSADQFLDPLNLAGQPRRMPATTSERQLQRLWGSTLNINPETISADDNFFRMGGDSIQAMRLVSAAQSEGISLAVSDILRRPILHQLAASSNKASTKADSTPSPRHLSLLEVEDANAFVLDKVRPALPAAVGEIVDVLPISHTQKEFLCGSLTHKPIGIHWFYVNLPSTSNTTHLVDCCASLIQHFEILRTVFVDVEGDFYQVTLQDLNAPVEVYTVTDSLQSAAESIASVDQQDQPSVSGRSFLRFVILRNEGEICLLVRLSHAQYDGIGIRRIFSGLRDLYNGQKLPVEPPISSVISLEKTHVDYTYWDNLLTGASMSVIGTPTPLPEGINNYAFTTIQIERTIPFWRSHAQASGMTPATVFTAACASMLAQLNDSSDVLFGRLFAGRASLPSTIHDIVFPCLTSLPIRIQSNSLKKPGVETDVLKQVHDQYVRALDYERIGIDHLAANCASWPQAAQELGVLSMYQDLEVDTRGDSSSVASGDCESSEFLPRGLRAVGDELRRSNTVLVVGVPRGEDLKVLVIGKSNICDKRSLEEAMEKLVTAQEPGP